MGTLKPKLEKDLDYCVQLVSTLQSANDVAEFLEVPLGQLLYILYQQEDRYKYESFSIPKKTKGTRSIHAPKGSTKILQEKIKPILCRLYRRKACVHGFVSNWSIVSNAAAHRKKKFILNIDLKDFFSTIHFGRIRGLFMSYPFHMGEHAASVMAQICTHEKKLPQGSPVSPILSNFIASDLDKKLTVLAKRYKLTYTRYADDITFSTSQNSFPRSIAYYEGSNPITNGIILGELLIETISSSGFEINYDKVRLQIKSVRQEVTGLTINEFPNVKREYVRNLRAMLNSWKKYGLLLAEDKLISKYAKNPPAIPEKNRDGTYFKNVLYGKLAFVKMVRGEDDDIYMKLCLKASALDTAPPKFIQKIKVMHEKFDVFLSHASEDKASIVRPIYDELANLGVSAFLDEVNLEWGDSLTEKINHALGQSKYVLAVLSQNSVDKKWPAKEINAALARELAGKQKILPLLVGDPDLSSLSLLEDKLYLGWEDNAKEIAEKIYGLLQKI
ncbi:TIR domain-containing anti-phage reverse transcriptase [Sessilibacter sp. MAH4]